MVCFLLLPVWIASRFPLFTPQHFFRIYALRNEHIKIGKQIQLHMHELNWCWCWNFVLNNAHFTSNCGETEIMEEIKIQNVYLNFCHKNGQLLLNADFLVSRLANSRA